MAVSDSQLAEALRSESRELREASKRLRQIAAQQLAQAIPSIHKSPSRGNKKGMNALDEKISLSISQAKSLLNPTTPLGATALSPTSNVNPHKDDISALKQKLAKVSPLPQTDRISDLVQATAVRRSMQVMDIVNNSRAEFESSMSGEAECAKRCKAVAIRELDALHREAKRKASELRRLGTDAREIRLLGSVANADNLLARVASIERAEEEALENIRMAEWDAATICHIRERLVEECRSAQRRNDQLRKDLAQTSVEGSKLAIGRNLCWRNHPITGNL